MSKAIVMEEIGIRTDAGAMKDFLEMLAILQNEAIVEANAVGLSVKYVDPAHVAMVMLDVESAYFQEYLINGQEIPVKQLKGMKPKEFVLDIEATLKFLKTAIGRFTKANRKMPVILQVEFEGHDPPRFVMVLNGFKFETETEPGILSVAKVPTIERNLKVAMDKDYLLKIGRMSKAMHHQWIEFKWDGTELTITPTDRCDSGKVSFALSGRYEVLEPTPYGIGSMFSGDYFFMMVQSIPSERVILNLDINRQHYAEEQSKYTEPGDFGYPVLIETEKNEEEITLMPRYLLAPRIDTRAPERREKDAKRKEQEERKKKLMEDRRNEKEHGKQEDSDGN